MKIIIVGDGKVGFILADYLSNEGHDVVIIDKNDDALKNASNILDVMCIKGNGASIEVLREAGAESAYLLIAVTTSDEMNMLCCFTARQLGTKHTIARIRDPEYYSELSSFKEFMGLSLVINPEFAAAQEIANLLQFPSANNIEFFVNGKIKMIEFRVLQGDVIVGKSIAEIGKMMLKNILICTLEREGKICVPNGDFVIKEGDKLNVIGRRENMTSLFKHMGKYKKGSNTVMIVGGGRIAYYLAQIITKSGMKPKIIEINPEKCRLLSEKLDDVVIIQGDGTEKELLDSENIAGMDAFIALTDRDEENLIISLYAIQCGVPKVIAKNNRLSYTEVVGKLGIDSIISPKSITANHILRYVRAKQNSQGSKIENLYKVVGGKAEVIEFIASASSQLLNIKLRNLQLKEGVLIAVIVKDMNENKNIIIPHGNEYITSGDRVIIVTTSGGFKDLDQILLHFN